MSARTDWRSEIYNGVAATVITLLIWLYANDRTRESASITGTVRITASDPRELYTEPTAAVTVNLEVRGTPRSIEKLQDALRNGISLATGSGGVPGAAGVHTIDLAEAIARDASVEAAGAEVVRASPQSLRMEIGKLVTDQVQVTPVLPRASIQGEIVVDPAVVTVTMPAAARESVGTLTLDAMVDTKNLGPGRSHAVDVELKLPESLNRWKELTRIVPPRAKVTFTLLATTAEYTLATVPVEIAIAPAALEQFRITLPAGSTTIANVVVSGPLASIDRIKRGEFVPAAVLAMTPRYLLPPISRKVPVGYWRLPEGVTVVSAAGTPADAKGIVPIEVSVDIAKAPTPSP